MDEYDVEEESDPENVQYKKGKKKDTKESEDEEDMEEEDMNEEDMDDEDEEEYDDEDEQYEDDKKGVNMNISELEKLYHMKDGKLVKKADAKEPKE